MSAAPARDRLYDLIDRLPADQVEHLLRLAESDPGLARYADEGLTTSGADGAARPPGRLAIICDDDDGLDDGPPDLAERSEYYLQECFNHSL